MLLKNVAVTLLGGGLDVNTVGIIVFFGPSGSKPHWQSQTRSFRRHSQQRSDDSCGRAEIVKHGASVQGRSTTHAIKIPA
jgi:hypothetical protein